MLYCCCQAERWGAELFTEDVEEVDLSVRPFRIRSSDREMRAHTVIVATGATARRLNLPSEQQYWSKGISACAICDGASPLFKNNEVAVVGGGDSAAEEAVYLTKYARKVHLLVRGEKMRASKAMQDRVLAHSRVDVHFNTAVEDAYGNGVLQGLRTVNTQTGQSEELGVQGLFYGIGHQPNSHLIAGQVELDEAGYVKVSQQTGWWIPLVQKQHIRHIHHYRIVAASSVGRVNTPLGVRGTGRRLGAVWQGACWLDAQQGLMQNQAMTASSLLGLVCLTAWSVVPDYMSHDIERCLL